MAQERLTPMQEVQRDVQALENAMLRMRDALTKLSLTLKDYHFEMNSSARAAVQLDVAMLLQKVRVTTDNNAAPKLAK